MTELFFIALLPPTGISEKIIALQKEVAVKFESRHALKSPPHITLVPPFKSSNDFEKLVAEPLSGFFHSVSLFNIHLNGFSCFEKKRVVYIDVIKNEQLEKVYHSLHAFAENNLPVQLQHSHEHFNPHISIGSRDLRKEMFRKAWNEFKDKYIEETFPVNSAWLLRHNGREWLPAREFEFRK